MRVGFLVNLYRCDPELWFPNEIPRCPVGSAGRHIMSLVLIDQDFSLLTATKLITILIAILAPFTRRVDHQVAYIISSPNFRPSSCVAWCEKCRQCKSLFLVCVRLFTRLSVCLSSSSAVLGYHRHCGGGSHVDPDLLLLHHQEVLLQEEEEQEGQEGEGGAGHEEHEGGRGRFCRHGDGHSRTSR